MKKIMIKKDFWPLVESVIIIGTETDTKQPNFLTCSWHIRVNQRPPQWGITIDHTRYSLNCIRKNMTYKAFHDMKSSSYTTKYLSTVQKRSFFI